MKKLGLIITSCFVLSLLSPVINAQTFSSGSTGADGVLDLTSGDREVQLPDTGILNYITVNIPSGRKLTFISNLRNSPVIILAKGSVTIAGSIDVSAKTLSITPSGGRTPGPGGFYGGLGVGSGALGQPGFGPGGGQPVNPNAGVNCGNIPIEASGKWVGPLSLVPIIGGSGGAGFDFRAGGGGGRAIAL